MTRRKPTGGKPATRSSRTKLLDDPDQRERELNAQLKSMSLYASQTSGDGNCLFRALSDQLYGTPDHHARLRQEICDYLAASPDRYAGFVDIEKPFDDYVKTMRENGTYGGHLELSAFASLKRKEIKIVQPGLVYVVSGDDDSRDALAERQAIEQERQKIQNSLPADFVGGPPLKGRDARHRKRLQRQSASSEPSSSRDASEEHGGEPTSQSVRTGVVEAFGPLYIAYHNWEHYSSVRNVAGPHAGLPRIIEPQVSLAQPSKDTERQSDEEDETYVKPTEHEELILRSVPGHTLSEVRFLLKQHGNLWESVVEVLIAQDAAASPDGSNGGGLGSSPPGALTRSRAPSNSYGGAGSPRLSQRSTAQQQAKPASSTSPSGAPLAVPEYLRGARHAWRGVSPSASSSGGDAASGSGHGTSDDTPSTAKQQQQGSTSSQADLPEEARGSHRLVPSSGFKRAASKDLMPLDGDERSPKRRSSSRERERDEKLVDGALASQFESSASTVGCGESSGSQTSLTDTNTPDAAESPVSHGGRERAAKTAPLNLEDDDLASYYSTRRRELSPPLTSDDIASLKAGVAKMSPKDKREWDLKKKRDRQRERRAIVRSQKEGKGAKAVSKRTSADPPKRKGKALTTTQASTTRSRREQRARQKGIDDGDDSAVVPKGFVELKI